MPGSLSAPGLPSVPRGPLPQPSPVVTGHCPPGPAVSPGPATSALQWERVWLGHLQLPPSWPVPASCPAALGCCLCLAASLCVTRALTPALPTVCLGVPACLRA